MDYHRYKDVVYKKEKAHTSRHKILPAFIYKIGIPAAQKAGKTILYYTHQIEVTLQSKKIIDSHTCATRIMQHAFSDNKMHVGYKKADLLLKKINTAEFDCYA